MGRDLRAVHRREDDGLILSEEHRPRSTRRRWFGRVVLLALLAAVVLGGYVGGKGLLRNFGPPTCTAVAVPGGPEVTFSPEQMANASTIAGVSVKRGLPPRAASIAITTAIQESKLRNLRYGDRDSLGLFQQRPSQGWGTAGQITDPVYASNRFYDELVKIPGYQDERITEIAQQIQRSGYPEAYADHETEGRALASVLTGQSPAGLGCRLDPVEQGAATSAEGFAEELTHQTGLPARSAGRHVVEVDAGTADHGWTAGAWAVAHAEADGVTSVTVGDRAWTRSRDESGATWQRAGNPTGAAGKVRIRLG
ncbi:MAG TPA: hypothetical protein VFJ12_02935 [Segeticoccus sp.]|jgi:hypothetical protein|nr:hypothetical protein [Segeticoccus sp.]